MSATVTYLFFILYHRRARVILINKILMTCFLWREVFLVEIVGTSDIKQDSERAEATRRQRSAKISKQQEATGNRRRDDILIRLIHQQELGRDGINYKCKVKSTAEGNGGDQGCPWCRRHDQTDGLRGVCGHDSQGTLYAQHCCDGYRISRHTSALLPLSLSSSARIASYSFISLCIVSVHIMC